MPVKLQRLCVDKEIHGWINALKYRCGMADVNELLHVFKNLLSDNSWKIPKDAVDAVKTRRT